MPKRKSESLEDDLERLFKKMKKLEKRIRSRDDANCSETGMYPLKICLCVKLIKVLTFEH